MQLAIGLLAFLLSATPLTAFAAETVTIRPTRDDAMLLNPGKGWVQYYGTDKYTKDYVSDGYEDMKKKGWWKPDVLKNIYFAGGRPSYMQWNPQIFEENREFCLSLGNYVGYHFVLQEAVLPTRFRRSDAFRFQLTWLNDGVTYLYEPCSVAIAFLDGDNKLVESQRLAGSSPKSWTPGQSKTETFALRWPSLPAGSYKVAIGLFLDEHDARPTYRLGIRGRTPDGWHVLYDGLQCEP